MARLSKRALELAGQSISQDWMMAREKLRAALRGRQSASVHDLKMHEGPPGPTGRVARSFSGTVTWQQDGVEATTRFLAMPIIVALADQMSEADFAQLLNMSCPGPGTAFDPRES